MRGLPGKVQKVRPGFLLLFIVKCRRKEKLRMELLNKKGPGFDDLKNSQPAHIAQRPRCALEKRPGVKLSNLFEEIRYMTCGST